MTNWYKDETANRAYEKQMHERYSECKLTSKIWQERAERMKALTASRSELLRRASEFLEINNPVLKEIKKELGDD